MCPLLQFEDGLLNGKKMLSLEDPKARPLVRTHEAWHERRHSDRTIAHTLMYFCQAHGSGTVLQVALEGSSPTRGCFAYGDNYFHTSPARSTSAGN